MNRRDFQRLAVMRLEDTTVLMRNGRYEAAYYLAGYEVECALKACIAKKTQRYDFPPDPKSASDVWTHKIELLLKQADLEKVLQSSVDEVKENWRITIKWKPEKRYAPVVSPQEAKDMVAAVADRRYGILRWIKRYW